MKMNIQTAYIYKSDITMTNKQCCADIVLDTASKIKYVLNFSTISVFRYIEYIKCFKWYVKITNVSALCIMCFSLICKLCYYSSKHLERGTSSKKK